MLHSYTETHETGVNTYTHTHTKEKHIHKATGAGHENRCCKHSVHLSLDCLYRGTKAGEGMRGGGVIKCDTLVPVSQGIFNSE